MKHPRTGIGFDAHDFDSRGTLVLGGVRFPGTPQLKGHSDGDALLHAVVDAILGAAGLGDIGEFFPDTAREWKGASSLFFLNEVLDKVKKTGLALVHLDVIVMADKPKLSGFKQKIALVLSKNTGLPQGAVNIKAKTSEGTRLLSDKGGIAVWAAATLVPAKKK